LFNEEETRAGLNEVLGTEVNLEATPQRADKATLGRKSAARRSPRIYRERQSSKICRR
jgi:hypothetical protein